MLFLVSYGVCDLVLDLRNVDLYGCNHLRVCLIGVCL